MFSKNCKYEIIAKKQKKLWRKSQLPLGLMPKKYHFSRETRNNVVKKCRKEERTNIWTKNVWEKFGRNAFYLKAAELYEMRKEHLVAYRNTIF